MHAAITALDAKCIDSRIRLSWRWSQRRMIDDAQPTDAARFRIWRKPAPDFVWGTDYEEFFLGATSENAELIFDGTLAPYRQAGRQFRFEDDAVSQQTTLMYFVQVDAAPAFGPAPVRVTDPEVSWNYARILAEIERLEECAGTRMRHVTAGFSATGRRIPAFELGTGGPRLALTGLVHAGESGPELMLPALRMLVEHDPQLFDRVRVIALPVVNVDGREQQVRGVPWYIRRTPGGVDINRNFPANWEEIAYGYGLDSSDPDSPTWRGAEAGAAPETRAVTQTFERHPPNAVLNYHFLGSLCWLPLLTPLYAAEDRAYQQHCQRIARAFAAGVLPDQPYEEAWARPGTSTGSLPAWVYQRWHAPVFDIEGHVGDEAVRIRAARNEVDRALLADFQDRHSVALGNVLRELLTHASEEPA